MNTSYYKQFVILPKKPKMSAGKLASQAVHASFMALEEQQINNKKVIQNWKKSGQTVIVLECKNIEQLLSATEYFEQWKIPHHLYIDEGHTEVDALTPTALATGVLTEDRFWMLNQFKVYGYKKSWTRFLNFPFRNNMILKAKHLNWLTFGVIIAIVLAILL